MGELTLKPYSMGDEAWPWLYNDGCREDQPRHFGDDPGHLTVIYSPFQLELEVA